MKKLLHILPAVLIVGVGTAVAQTSRDTDPQQPSRDPKQSTQPGMKKQKDQRHPAEQAARPGGSDAAKGGGGSGAGGGGAGAGGAGGGGSGGGAGGGGGGGGGGN